MNISLPRPSVGRALAWELWRLGRARVLPTFAGVASLVALTYSVVPPVEASDEPAFFYGFFWMAVICFVVVMLQCRDDPSSPPGFEARLFLLPVPTPVLVGWRMALPMLGVAVMYAAVAVLVDTFFGFAWPIWGPALVAMTAMAWTLAVFWTPVEPLLLRSLVGLVLAWVLVLWTGARFGALGASRPSRMWTVPEPSEILTLVAWVVGAYTVAVLGVTRDRHGRAVTMPGLRTVFAELARLPGRLPSPRRPVFSSPQQAQVWLEWRQKGWVMPLYAAWGLLLALGIQALDGFDTGAVLRSLVPMAGFMFWAFPPVIGAVMGRFSAVSHEPGLDLFRATRPLGDGPLAHVLLRAGLLTLLASWAVTAALSLAILSGLYGFGDREQVEVVWEGFVAGVRQVGYGPSLAFAGLVVLFGWMIMGLVTSLFLTGRNAIAVTFSVIPCCLAVGYVLLHDLIPASVMLPVIRFAPLCLGSAGLVGTILAFIAARRRGLIGRRGPWIALGLWLALVSGLAFSRWDALAAVLGSGLALERSFLLLVMGTLALALSPPAMAPLALAWNRHR